VAAGGTGLDRGRVDRLRAPLSPWEVFSVNCSRTGWGGKLPKIPFFRQLRGSHFSTKRPIRRTLVL
jgi:hypothetical protein